MYEVLLVIHISAGFTALVTGAVAASVQKGGHWHILSGKVFVISMLVSAVASVLLSFIKTNGFLLGIGLFTIYLTLSGWLLARGPRGSQNINGNKIAGISGLLISVWMVIYGLKLGNNGVEYVLYVFAGILTYMSFIDLRRKSNKDIPGHASKIGGAYIAATTAFLVVNNQFLPPLLAWLGPSVIGSVLITIGIRKWRKG